MVTAPEAEVYEEDSSLDVETLITAFLKDPSRPEVKLPPMTPEQRIQAKQLVAKHPELKCESYGMGTDRRLHLFKKGSSGDLPNNPPSAVNVKNTFIDDWVLADGEAPPEPVVFRSMPLQAGGKSPLLDSILEAGPRHADFCMNEKHSTGAEEQRTSGSLAADRSSPEGALRASSGNGCQRELPRLPEELRSIEVRNTFLHIERIEGDSVDERVIQSMPHGMFRSQLAAESEKSLVSPASIEVQNASAAPWVPGEKESVASTEGPPPPPSQPPDFSTGGAGMAPSQQFLTPGTPIMVEGLVRAPAFNGLSGVVQNYEEDTGRYSVLLSSPGHPNGVQWAKIKGDNLRLAMPPPPYSAMSPEVNDAFVSAPPPPHHAMAPDNAQCGPMGQMVAAPQPLGAATPLRLTALV